MSVEVKGLTKIYGTQRAVDNISFSAKPGEILGFLGPNGAGKSTTMKMLTCFLEPTSGSASVCGYSISDQSIEVRRNIGYLPEHNPLYMDMYVLEFLKFIAKLVKVDNSNQRIKDLVEMTGLGREQHKVIGSLSKGYKQRVGLAQALISDPEVLILDEPTSGLDPNQLSDIRSLIREIGNTKTLIFSTHIMQEVTALCDRVIIINQGKLVANDPIQNLHSRIENHELTYVEFLENIDIQKLNNINGVDTVTLEAKNRFKISSKNDIRKELFQFAVINNVTLLELRKEDMDIEDIFHELTKSNINV